MDGAKANDRDQTISVNAMRWWVGGRGACCEAWGVSLGETGSSADLGDSSKYSNENFEDWGGERFRVNSNCTRVSRS